MRVIIDIEEGRYNWIMSHASNNPKDYTNTGDMVFRKAVESGTVLPKGHGDLIDRDVAIADFDSRCLNWSSNILESMPIVIPADKDET